MRSIPVAMTWEMLSHGRWVFPVSFLGGNLLPVLLLSALRLNGVAESDDPSTVIMHFMFVQIIMFSLAAGVLAAQGAPARLFAWPIRTATLVACQMSASMLLVGLETFVSIAALNSLFDLSWPLWGPALFAATSVAAIQATLWLTEKSPAWLPWAFALVAAGLGIWLKSRYGDTFSQPSRYWSEVTPSEVLTMLVVIAVSFYVAVIGVARQRRGDVLPSFGVLEWFERTFDSAPRVGERFRTPAQAQYWYEWRQKGWAMPAAVLFGMVVGCGGWLIFSRDFAELLTGFYAGGGMLSVVAMVAGMLLGVVGTSDSDLSMGHFRATRPLTNVEMSRILLKVGAKSVLLAWSYWAVAFGVILLTLMSCGAFPQKVLSEWRHLGWWYLPLTLLGPWTVMGLIASMSLKGSTSLVTKSITGVVLLILSRPLLVKFVVPYHARPQFDQAIPVLLGVAFVLATSWAFAAARRRGLVSSRTIGTLAGLWFAMSTIVSLSMERHTPSPVSASIFAIGLLATAAAPLATAPLALAWNRNR